MEAALLAEEEGLTVAPFWMHDDISSAPPDRMDDHRGAAGTFFCYKILGADTEEELTLPDLVGLGEAVRGSTRTLGAALGPGVSPPTGGPMFDLPAGEVFVGMGLHGGRPWH